MYVKSVKVHNIRGFSGPRNVELFLGDGKKDYAGLTVIAGRNGAGKTTLLRAIALALAGPSVSRNLVTGFDDWVSDNHDEGTVQLGVTFDTNEDFFTGGGRLPASREFELGLRWKVPRAGDATTHENFRGTIQPVMSEITPVARRKLTPTRGPWADNPAGWLTAAYGPFRRLAGGATDTQRIMMGPVTAARLVTLFHEDASLAESVTWLIDRHLRSLEMRPGAEELLANIVRVLSDGLLPDGYLVDKVDADGLWVRRGDHLLSLREMSDGYRTVASLVLDILRQFYATHGALHINETADGHVSVKGSGVVLIDELDVHLHVSWQKKIGNWLKSHFPDVQFIVTTHSPYVCQAADEQGLISLFGPHAERAPEIVSDEVWRRVVYGGGDDAVVSELFGLDTPYSDAATAIQAEAERLEVAVLTGLASDEQVEEYRELTEKLAQPLIARVEDVVRAHRGSDAARR